MRNLILKNVQLKVFFKFWLKDFLLWFKTEQNNVYLFLNILHIFHFSRFTNKIRYFSCIYHHVSPYGPQYRFELVIDRYWLNADFD